MLARALTILSIGVCVWPSVTLAQKRFVSKDVSPNWKYVQKRLSKFGFGKPFIKALQANYEKDKFKEVLELNTLLFLRKSDCHGSQVNDDSVEHIRDFLEKNGKTLRRAEREDRVPAAVIASLLWMESRYGKNTGRFNMPSVYVDLLQADRASVIRYLQTEGAHRFTTHVGKRASVEIAKRARRKSKWALSELRAVEKIFKKRGKVALKMRGSFSGAGGLPQFLPSSYLKWARAKKPHATPNLNKTDDAILSVANFLHANGWRRRSKTHMQALMNYNNSHDYANAILNLASRAGKRDGPLVASEVEK